MVVESPEQKKSYLKMFRKTRAKYQKQNAKHLNNDCAISRSPEYYKKINLKSREKNLERHILYAIKYSAKRRGMEFNLELSDIVIPKFCPLLGIEITKCVGKGKLPSNPSVDRIDNSKGYIKGNVMIMSNKANSMKYSASKEELITFAENILRIYSK